MRLSSPQAAAAVADATGLPVAPDRVSVALPQALVPHADAVASARAPRCRRRRRLMLHILDPDGGPPVTRWLPPAPLLPALIAAAPAAAELGRPGPRSRPDRPPRRRRAEARRAPTRATVVAFELGRRVAPDPGPGRRAGRRRLSDGRQGYQIGNGRSTHEAYTDAGHLRRRRPRSDARRRRRDRLHGARTPGGDATVVGEPRRRRRRDPHRRSPITDPLDPGDESLRLPVPDGLRPRPGGRASSYVDYDFSLDSGDLQDDLRLRRRPERRGATRPPANPEDSLVTTPAYTQHLLSRWVTDRTTLRIRAAPGADILDGDKAQVGRGCGRSGADVQPRRRRLHRQHLRPGPSDPLVDRRQQRHLHPARRHLLPARHDMLTYLRVHSGIGQVSASSATTRRDGERHDLPELRRPGGSHDRRRARRRDPGSGRRERRSSRPVEWEQVTGSHRHAQRP